MSLKEPPLNLEILVRYCLTGHFPSWFETKQNSQVTHGSRNFFNLVQRIKSFSNKHVQEIALSVEQRNGYFDHPANVSIAMLRDDNENVRNVGVPKVLALRKPVSEESANNDDCPHLLNSFSIRLFDVPTLNLEANAYYKLANVDSYQEQPPPIASLIDTEIEECLKKPLVSHHPCHNQSVERHVKLVTEASAQVAGFDR